MGHLTGDDFSDLVRSTGLLTYAPTGLLFMEPEFLNIRIHVYHIRMKLLALNP